MLIIIILLIIVLLFICINWFVQAKQSCDCDFREGLVDSSTAKCSLVKAVYELLIGQIVPDNLIRFSDPNNYQYLNTTCDLGNVVLNRCNQYNWFTNPMNNSAFVTLCCNGENDQSKCTMGAECINKKAQLAQSSLAYTNLNDITDNAAALETYCDLGKDIITSGCSVDALHPQNDSVYKEYCCNSSGDMSTCGSEMFEACTLGQSTFATQSYAMKTWTNVMAGDNASTIKDFCNLGLGMLANGCTTVANPMTDPNFIKYCCNMSTDQTKCSTTNVDTCIAPLGAFLLSDSQMTNINPLYNQSLISAYCQQANSIVSNGCANSNLTNTANYNTLCKTSS